MAATWQEKMNRKHVCQTTRLACIKSVRRAYLLIADAFGAGVKKMALKTVDARRLVELMKRDA